MSCHRGEEVVAIQRVQHHIGLGDHGRRARHVPKERDLAEVAAFLELGHVRPPCVTSTAPSTTM